MPFTKTVGFRLNTDTKTGLAIDVPVIRLNKDVLLCLLKAITELPLKANVGYFPKPA